MAFAVLWKLTNYSTTISYNFVTSIHFRPLEFLIFLSLKKKKKEFLIFAINIKNKNKK